MLARQAVISRCAQQMTPCVNLPPLTRRRQTMAVWVTALMQRFTNFYSQNLFKSTSLSPGPPLPFCHLFLLSPWQHCSTPSPPIFLLSPWQHYSTISLTFTSMGNAWHHHRHVVKYGWPNHKVAMSRLPKSYLLNVIGISVKNPLHVFSKTASWNSVLLLWEF